MREMIPKCPALGKQLPRHKTDGATRQRTGCTGIQTGLILPEVARGFFHPHLSTHLT